MEIAITKMSQNGQVVIPAEIRKDAGLKPASKFLVFNDGDDILLKRLDKGELLAELELIRDIECGEEDLARGDYIAVDSSISDKELHKKLMGK